ncbi:glycosyltransferase family 4 protein [Aquibacillus sediminis]|uniref:glycosyltransferase family 4 protein n=1 Tax=Aquibacillus sediminis TaxID=2574734 RepID=UPI0011099B29|nr:glycosyltransferase family 4 protein [Aquibacillus sediminis]
MKVLVIWRLLTVGGVNAGWRNRAKYLKQQGISVEFLYYKDLGGMHVMEDVAPVYLTKKEDEIVEIIQQNSYDLIIVVDTPKAYKWLNKANYQGPVLVEARTPEIVKLQKNLVDFETVSPAKVIVPSEHQKRVLSLLVDQSRPIEVIYNGIDTDFFKPLNRNEIDQQQDPVRSPDKKVVTYIGRLDKRKNWRLLLRIAEEINRTRQDIEFWVVGGAKSKERDLFAETLKKQQLDDIVKWYPVVPYQQMPHMYAKIRESQGCTIATTRAESFGNTFIESMACGVPVVAPSVSSIPEIVRHGKMGYLFKEEDVNDAVSQIENIVDQNNEDYDRMSVKARKQVEKHFSIEQVADQYAALLKQVVERDGTP